MTGPSIREGALPLPLEGPAGVEAVLRWAVGAVAPGRLALVSAFGPGSLVVVHHAARMGLDLPVIFVDTLHHFPETLEHVERVRERYRLDLRVVRPAPDRAAFEAIHGPRLWERDLERYQQVARVEPFRRAAAHLDGWITGRRRDQGGERSTLPLVEVLPPSDSETAAPSAAPPGIGVRRFRINPLAAWTRAQVWSFILEHRIPYNPLHDRGYPSVGDEPLTTPAAPDEEERAGRWRGTSRTECGIHGP